MKAFREQGYEVWVAAGSFGAVPYADHVVELPFQKRFFSFRNLEAILKARALMKRERFEILSAHTTLAGAIIRAAALLLRNRPKVFYTCHGYLFSEAQGLRKWAYLLPEKLCARVTDVLMTMNGEDYELARRHRLSHGKLCAINGMGFHMERFAPISSEERKNRRTNVGFREEEVLFIYAAEFSKRKNQRLLIRAFAAAAPGMPDARLLLAGSGVLLEDCRELARSLQMENRICFEGQVDDMAALYPLCDAVVTPSLSEGLPFHLMEAMACGLPAVASDVKGHRELVGDEETGLLFKSGETGALAEKLLELYRRPELRAQYGAEAREKVGKYALNEVFPTLLEQYGIRE